MKKRMFIMLIVVGLLLGGLVGFNMFKAHMIQQFMANAPVPTATVTAMKADYQQWQPQIDRGRHAARRARRRCHHRSRRPRAQRRTSSRATR